MKFIIGLFSLVISSVSYANCTISYISDNPVLKKKGFNLKNKEELCLKLQKANAGIKIGQVSQITENETAVATMIRLYPLDIASKYDQILASNYTVLHMIAGAKRTSESEREFGYRGINSAIENADIDKMIKEVEAIRTIVK